MNLREQRPGCSGSVCVLAVLLSVLTPTRSHGRVKGPTWILGWFSIATFLPQSGVVYRARPA